MMIVIPTYQVEVWTNPEDDPMIFRVPETDLSSFVNVVIFNKPSTFKVSLIAPHDPTNQQLSEIFRQTATD